MTTDEIRDRIQRCNVEASHEVIGEILTIMERLNGYIGELQEAVRMQIQINDAQGKLIDRLESALHNLRNQVDQK